MLNIRKLRVDGSKKVFIFIFFIMTSLILCKQINVAYAADLNFKDVSTSSWYYNDLVKMFEKGYIVGYKDSTFKANKTLTDGELIKMLVCAVNENKKFCKEGKYWITTYAKNAYEMGMLDDEDNESKVYSTLITREDMAELVYRAVKLGLIQTIDSVTSVSKDVVKGGIDDFTSISSEKGDAVIELYRLGIIKGNGKGKFLPKSVLTRAEATAILNRVVIKRQDFINDKKIDYNKINGYVKEDGTIVKADRILKLEEETKEIKVSDDEKKEIEYKKEQEKEQEKKQEKKSSSSGSRSSGGNNKPKDDEKINDRKDEDIKLENEKIVIFSDYGGVPNDLSFDNSVILKKIIEEANGEKVIVLDSGNYEFKSSIVIDKEVKDITITGIGVSRYFNSKYNDATSINWTGTGELLTFKKSVKNFNVRNTNIQCNNNSFIRFESLLQDARLENIYIKDSINAIKISDYKNVLLNNISSCIESNTSDYQLLIDAKTISENMKIMKCSFDGTNGSNADAIIIYGGSDITLAEADICNWGKGIALLIEQKEDSKTIDNIVIKGINVIKSNGGIQIKKMKSGTNIYGDNISLIFSQDASNAQENKDIKGIYFEGNDKIKATILGINVRRVGSANAAEYFFNLPDESLSDDSFIETGHVLTSKTSFNIAGNPNITYVSRERTDDRKRNDNFETIQRKIDTYVPLIDNYSFYKEINDKIISNYIEKNEGVDEEADSLTNSKGIYTIEQFGGKSNDDSVDNSIALKDAINFMKSKAGILLFGEGTYYFKTPIVITDNFSSIMILGNKDKTKIEWFGEGYLLTLKNEMWWSRIDGFTVLCHNNSFVDNKKLFYKSYMTNLNIENCDTGLNFDGFAYGFISDVVIKSSEESINPIIIIGKIKNTREFIYFNNVELIGNGKVEQIGLDMYGSTHLYISGVTLKNLGKGVKLIRATSASMVSLVYFENLVFDTCKEYFHFIAEEFIEQLLISFCKSINYREGDRPFYTTRLASNNISVNVKNSFKELSDASGTYVDKSILEDGSIRDVAYFQTKWK